MAEQIRPTKKQKELLMFIQSFITQHGYSPSYREIMNGMNYNSVATVSLHVNSLIRRGHIKKRDRSARSLEVVQQTPAAPATTTMKPNDEKWLVEKVEYLLHQAEAAAQLGQAQIDQLYVLVGALKVLGLEAAAQSFIPRLTVLKSNI